jgi:hypothetical protein
MLFLPPRPLTSGQVNAIGTEVMRTADLCHGCSDCSLAASGGPLTGRCRLEPRAIGRPKSSRTASTSRSQATCRRSTTTIADQTSADRSTNARCEPVREAGERTEHAVEPGIRAHWGTVAPSG